VPATTPRIIVTAGEPAGVGPELALSLADQNWAAEIVVLADPATLKARAEKLGKKVDIQSWQRAAGPVASQAGKLQVLPITMAEPDVCGEPRQANVPELLESLRTAAQGCLNGEYDAMVTAPVQKSIINDAGFAFSGHTEFLAEECAAPLPVMMLVSKVMRVALLTTHLPLSEVAEQVTTERISSVCRIIAHDLEKWFGLSEPRIAVLGLNPHAGEGGHLGQEEIREIIPALKSLHADGISVLGPLPADTALTHDKAKQVDAILAMYHDQGLPVLKYSSFGEAVNVTLGLPIIRTSVDHGTALDIAGQGTVDTGSMQTAVQMAIDMASRTQP
jgi:4-hydroxythreonine-4-phosphate dehydrogenase